MKKQVGLVVCISLLTFTLLACQLTGLVPTQPASQPTLTPLPGKPVNLISESDGLVTLYARVAPGVVTIKTYSSSSGSLGSGWVYSADGYIITNEHVVEGADSVEIDFPTGLKVFGKIVGADKNSDLAVIKVDVTADQLHPLTLSDSDLLQVGQVVVAIGDPFGYSVTMTTGIVSAIGRSITSQAQAPGGAYFSSGDLIETDALLNRGNSGGPLLNLQGEVVGVNEAIQLDPTSGFPSGIGYAISVNLVKRVAPALIAKGKFDYPYLGISTLDDLPLTTIQDLGLKSFVGAYVTEVVSGGPADQAGLHAATGKITSDGLNSGGDLIVAVDGQPVRSLENMMRYLVLHKSPGDTVVLTVLRGDQKLDLNLTLGARP